MVAPELLPALEALPQFVLADGDDDADPRRLKAALAAVRAALDFVELPQPEGALAEVDCTEHEVPAGEGTPGGRMLVYTPPGKARARPAYFFVHGGGYVVGTPELNDYESRELAVALDCVVVSPAYRLAPEHPYPAARDDLHAALLHVRNVAERLGIEAGNIAIGGQSAGAGHAAVLALHERELAGQGKDAVIARLLHLDIPMLDDRTGTLGDPHPHAGEFVWTPWSNRFGWSALLGTTAGGDDVPEGAVPARAGSLAGLPPCLLIVGAIDLFVEETLEFARRLMREGVPTELHVLPGMFHASRQSMAGTPQYDQLHTTIVNALNRAFARA